MKAQLLLTLCAVAAIKAQNTPAPAAGNVTLPLDEYNQLVERAGQLPKPRPAPPVPYVLKIAQMNSQVTGESVSGTVSIEGEVLAQGDREVPLVKRNGGSRGHANRAGIAR
jgi:hypothetical protein